MSGAALVFHQFRYDQKTFWRDPASVFFTVLLPLIFLFIFATIFGNETIEELGDQDEHVLRAGDHHAWRWSRRRWSAPRSRSPRIVRTGC